MPSDILQCSNLIRDRIANADTQTVGDFGILFGGLQAQGAFGRDRSAVNGTQSPRDEGDLPALLRPKGKRGGCRAVSGLAIPLRRHLPA